MNMFNGSAYFHLCEFGVNVYFVRIYLDKSVVAYLERYSVGDSYQFRHCIVDVFDIVVVTTLAAKSGFTYTAITHFIKIALDVKLRLVNYLAVHLAEYILHGAYIQA